MSVVIIWWLSIIIDAKINLYMIIWLVVVTKNLVWNDFYAKNVMD